MTGTASPGAARPSLRARLGNPSWMDLALPVVFIVLLAIAALASDTFLTQSNLTNLLRQIVINGLLSLGMLASAAAEAMTPEQLYIASCRKDPGMPVPIEVVSPRVGAAYEGSTVTLEFIVDEHGKPGEIIAQHFAYHCLRIGRTRRLDQTG